MHTGDAMQKLRHHDEQRAALSALGFTDGDEAPAEVSEDPKA